MSFKKPIFYEYKLEKMSGVDLLAVVHVDDRSNDAIELKVTQGGEPIDLTGATVKARVVTRKTHVLINDNVPCTVNESGNIFIPLDRPNVETVKGDLKIEINITNSGGGITLQFPLWVRVNGSILDDATVDQHSKGTIPELLEEVKEELERVKDFATAEDVFEILDGALEGNPNTAPTLLIDNTVDQQFNPGGHWIMYYIDSDDLRHNIFDFTNLPSGASDYTALENKPQINSVTLLGNKSSDDLGLQKKLTAGTNITIGNDGTISASGGVTSYNDLTDKPLIEYYMGNGGYSTAAFTGTLATGLSAPIIISKIGTAPNNQFYIGLDSKQVFLIKTATSYDVDTVSYSPFFLVLSANRLSHLPSFVSPRFGTGVSLLNLAGKNCGEQIQLLFWRDSNYGSHYAFRVFGASWQELGGSSQIVSGVVNQNGTITFTNSDGSTFTTSGSKLVISGSEQISMGYDSGGFYFLFDDGQEAS